MRSFFGLLLIVTFAAAAPYINYEDLLKIYSRDGLSTQPDGTREYSGGPSLKSLIKFYGPVRYGPMPPRPPMNTFSQSNIHEING